MMYVFPMQGDRFESRYWVYSEIDFTSYSNIFFCLKCLKIMLTIFLVLVNMRMKIME